MEFSLENRQGPYFGFKNMEAYLRSKFACTIPLPKRPRLYRAPGYAPISSPSAPPVTVYRRRSRYLKMVLSFDDSYIFKLKDSSLIGYLVFLRGEYLQLKNAIRTVALKLSQDARDSSFAETRRRHELSRGFDVEDDAMFIPNLLSEEERSYGRLARAIAMRAIPFTPYNPVRYRVDNYPWRGPVPSHRVRRMMHLTDNDLHQTDHSELYLGLLDFQKAYEELEQGADTWGLSFSMNEDFAPLTGRLSNNLAF